MVAPRIDWSLLQRYVQEGRGLGHGEAYRPFIQLKRWNASPVSVQTLGCIPPYRRQGTFLCRSEWLLSLLLAWVGCHVREQFPIWPWKHPHPLYGLSDTLDANLRWSSGTMELCREVGVKHGTFVGTNIPYIWTIDLVATLAWAMPDEHACVLISVKPLLSEEYTGDVDPLARGPQKLEVERRYSLELGLPYFVADRSRFPGPLLGQLEYLSAAATIPSDGMVATGVKRFLERHGEGLSELPPLEWRDRLSRDFGLTTGGAEIAVHHLLWTLQVDVDLTREVTMEEPVRPGGRVFRAVLREALSNPRR